MNDFYVFNLLQNLVLLIKNQRAMFQILAQFHDWLVAGSEAVAEMGDLAASSDSSDSSSETGRLATVRLFLVICLIQCEHVVDRRRCS
jgi:hypothetical protein